MNKQVLRERLKVLYREADLTKYVASSVQQVRENKHFLRASDILAYEPMTDEVPFIEELRRLFSEKSWFKPSYTQINFISFRTGETWVPGARKTLAIVPARAVTMERQRLGRGGGWYDRFLSKHSNELHCLVVIPEFAVLEEFPVSAHDVPMNEIILTNLEVY